MYHPAWIAPEVDREMIRYWLIWSSLNHLLSKKLLPSAPSLTRNYVSGIEEESGRHQHQSGGHVELRYHALGALHQGDPLQWPHSHGDRDEDRHGGNEARHQPRYFPPHGEVDQNLYEWRPRQATNLWSDHTNPGENEKIINNWISTGLSFSLKSTQLRFLKLLCLQSSSIWKLSLTNGNLQFTS